MDGIDRHSTVGALGRGLLLFGFAVLASAVSLCSQVYYYFEEKLWVSRVPGDTGSPSIVVLFMWRHLFAPLAGATLLWWLLLGWAGWRLWRRRGRFGDLAVVLPLALASGVMYLFYNLVYFREVATGWPLPIWPGPGRGIVRWRLGALALDFAVWVAAFGLICWPLSRRELERLLTSPATWRRLGLFALLVLFAAVQTCVCLGGWVIALVLEDLRALEFRRFLRILTDVQLLGASAAVVATFLWWLALGWAAVWLWRRRRAPGDLVFLVPAVFATGVMHVFQNRLLFELARRFFGWTSYPLRDPLPGWPWPIIVKYEGWSLASIVGDFLFWWAAAALALLAVWAARRWLRPRSGGVTAREARRRS